MIYLDFYKTGDGTKQFWGDLVLSTCIDKVSNLNTMLMLVKYMKNEK